MGQVKKPEVRGAILSSALRLFARKGYARTTLEEIARAAGVSTANVYVYFGSKLEILYALYDPWLRERVERLELELAKIRSPRNRLKRLLVALWRDIPAEENGFLNNIMQAITLTDPKEGYRSTLVQWLEARLEAILVGALPESRRAKLKRARLAHVVIMAFDGFAIHRHLHPEQNPIDDTTISAVVDMLLGNDALPARGRVTPRRASPPASR